MLAAVGEELCGSRSNIVYSRFWAHLRKKELIWAEVGRAVLRSDEDGVSRKNEENWGAEKTSAQEQTMLAYRWPWQAKTYWFYDTCIFWINMVQKFKASSSNQKPEVIEAIR